MRQVFRFIETRLDGCGQGALYRGLGLSGWVFVAVAADAVYLNGEDEGAFDRAAIRIENALLERGIKYVTSKN